MLKNKVIIRNLKLANKTHIVFVSHLIYLLGNFVYLKIRIYLLKLKLLYKFKNHLNLYNCQPQMNENKAIKIIQPIFDFVNKNGIDLNNALIKCGI